MTAITKEPLTQSERERLDELESTIDHGRDTFLEVGRALIAIRDEQLYREAYPSWEAYCRGRWNFTGRNGYYQLSALQTVAQLSSGGASALPEHESTVRSLSGVEPEAKGVIWNRAVESAGGKPPTAKQVKAERDRFIVEQSPYEHVKELVNNCSLQPDKAAALVVVLDEAPKPARALLEKAGVTDPSLGREITRLYRDKSDTYNELKATGVIQSSSGVKPLKNASVGDLRAYLDEKAREHRLQAQAERDADREVRSVSALLWRNDAERTYKELCAVLSTSDLIELKTILNARVH